MEEILLSFVKVEMVTMTYALIVECRVYRDRVRITAQCRDHITPTRQMRRMLHQFEHVLHRLNDATSHNRNVDDIEITSKEDKSEVLAWNSKSQYTAVEDFIHHIFERQALQQPHSPAIESWDGNFTYETLNATSTRLAEHLKTLGVGANVFVPLCFDKSARIVVAILVC